MILTVLIKHEPSVTYISFINASSINFQDFFRNEYGDANAIQGYAIFEQWKEDSCPFEAVSRNDSFQFTDNTELIFIQSAYTNQTLYSFSDPDSLEFSQRKGLCQWRFKSPPGYGFKVIITKSNFTENTNFIVENSTHVITK
uniref:Uncharacterized protein n=1 Tax=Panagrolaimus sp. PS1159 TaxID=55785 RepID=A0AC35FFI0_9BILA